MIFKKNKRVNQAFFDWYSLRHFIFGIIGGIILVVLKDYFQFLSNLKSFLITGFVITVIWEIFEITLREVKQNNQGIYKFLNRFLPSYLFVRESKVNIISDILLGMFGILIAYLLF